MLRKLISALAACLLLGACLSPGQGGAPASAPINGRLAALEAQMATLEQQLGAQGAGGASLAELQARVDALEARLGGPTTGSAYAARAFGVALAQYIMDTAGFHAMDAALNETLMVDPAYLSSVNRVIKVLSAAPWPEALAEDAQALQALLGDLAAALEADDGARAAELAASVHEAQHDLSHAIDDWLGEAGDAH